MFKNPFCKGCVFIFRYQETDAETVVITA